ncbi:metal ABC transporter substrate-binding protein [Aeromicrobium phragmitis]|uniref:Metal ABC transporter substrate-binding protein n=1 Tax=Aeromicrobium phragmitis TaxID=2478914 RepID=A0A3L8PH99_9ACTN|nr:zinc ABC transporter substrate-binding protein [Aeromicrobium phragmitis]RLV54545.1 metal ABC transporter substrate-binding protein [Aeromicrobium phragmitis]
MPNIRSIGAIVTGAALLAACTPAPAEVDERPYVVATFTVVADMAREIGGDAVRVESLIRPGAEVHGYEPTPGDLRRADAADLLIDNGLGLEAWFGQFTQRLDVPRVVVSRDTDPLPIVDSEHANPHAWMSPREAQRYVDVLEEALIDLAPDAADEIAARADDYRTELSAIETELLDALASLPPERRVLVTCEGAFSYLARDAGLDEVFLWPVNAEQQTTPQGVLAVAQAVEERGVPAVFCESTVSDRTMREIAEEAGTRFAGTLYVDSVSAADGPVPTYLDLLRHDVRTIAAGLGGGA